MPFENLKDNLNEIQEESKAYIDSNIAYFKLWGFKVIMQSTTVVLKFVLLTLCVSLFIVFASVALALTIGKFLDSYVYGFLIVAGIYLALAILLSFVKPKIVEGKILKRFSEIFFND